MYDSDVRLVRLVVLALVRRGTELLAGPFAPPYVALGAPTAVGAWADVELLVTHRDAETPAFVKALRSAVGFVHEYLPDELGASFDLDLAVDIACRINNNALGMVAPDGSNTVAGFGLFPFSAILNHSCRPNTAFLCVDGAMTLRCTAAVTACAPLVIRYIDVYQPRYRRQKELATLRHFVCECLRCAGWQEPHERAIEAEVAGIRCTACAAGMLVPDYRSSPPGATPPFACECGALRSPVEADALLAPLMSRLEAARLARTTKNWTVAFNLATELAADALAVLHPHHWLLFNTYPIVMNAARVLGRLAEGIAACLRVLECMRAVYGEFDEEIVAYGDALASMLAAAPQIDDCAAQAAALEDAWRGAVVCCGAGHAVTVRLRATLDAIRPAASKE